MLPRESEKRMKGSLNGLRSTKLPFILVTLLCLTILIWGWDKTPFLSYLLPSQSRLLQLSPEFLVDSPVTSVTPEEWATEGQNLPYVERNASSHGHAEGAYDKTVQDVAEGVDGKGFQDTAQGENDKAVQDAAEGVAGKAVQDPAEGPESTDVAAPLGDGKKEEIAHGVDSQVPVNSANRSSYVVQEDRNKSTRHVNESSCNLAVGKWVEDDSRPFYSGFECKQWLSQMWACRLTQRTDFSYEKFRWQPRDCNMEEFGGNKFLQRMQDKTLAFVGDSLGRQQFQSLMCMVSGGKQMPVVQNVGWEYGLVKARHAVRPDGWAYRFPGTNTTILYYWSASLCDLQPLNKNTRDTDVAMHLDRPPSFLRRYLHRFNVLVLNTGHHWNRGKINANRWVMHVGGMPNTNKKIATIDGAKNFTIHSIVNWVNSQLPKHPNLKAFYRSMSPRHFFNGDWNTGGTCDNTNPLSKGKEILKYKPSDFAAARALKGTNITFLDITGLSELRDEGHISRYSVKGTPGVQDCLHWCLPGIPDTWNELLFAQI